MVLQKDSDIKLIHTIDERKDILEKTMLDHLIVQPFTKEFSNLTASEFVKDILVNQLHIKHIIIGYDHRFGKNRSATIENLRTFGVRYDFTVEEISVQDINDVAVSSTKIRTAILDGDLKVANAYLGKPFQINGTVTKGKGIGKTINYPTANIKVAEDYKIIPKNGVYIATANINNEVVLGMMNIGTNPTVNGIEKTIEINLFNFDEDIYNQNIKVTVLERIRDERKFESLTHLQNQLEKDKLHALDYFNNRVK